MATLGKFNNLEIISSNEAGLILNGNQLGEILLPAKQAPENYSIGDFIHVFLYVDGPQSVVATTVKPKIELHQCAYLKCSDVNKYGAFFDWGLTKELLVPYAEQPYKVYPGLNYTLYLYSDSASRRLVGSLKLSKYLHEKNDDFTVNQQVDLLICGKSRLGYKAVINQTHLGLIHNSEVFRPIRLGQNLKGYIKQIREDGKINLGFALPDAQKLDDLAQKILDDLKATGGVSSMTDKSPPQEIYNKWNVSKGSYKRALGTLYRQRLINIDKQQISLADKI